MSYPEPTLWQKITLPFRIFYWRWFWKPIDYDEEPCELCHTFHPENKPCPKS
jgi:hypothetical protein